MTTKFHAKFDGKCLIPTEPVELPEDEILDVEISGVVSPPIGSPQRLLEVMHAPPHIPAEDVAELERLIESGKQPVKYDGVFDETE